MGMTVSVTPVDVANESGLLARSNPAHGQSGQVYVSADQVRAPLGRDGRKCHVARSQEGPKSLQKRKDGGKCSSCGLPIGRCLNEAPDIDSEIQAQGGEWDEATVNVEYVGKDFGLNTCMCMQHI
ncbi:hypothetical protein PspLS_10799 [Pyricularia sp. CBS 133598]|nr:hypothetical protein PspLS_10799 [Pyricularia sp. CBS 133598]